MIFGGLPDRWEANSSAFQNIRSIDKTSKSVFALILVVQFTEQKEGAKELLHDEPYFSRRLERQHRCENSPTSNVVNLQRMTYDDKHKVIMCVVPKVRNFFEIFATLKIEPKHHCRDR